jgi:hypothetical protein
MGAILLYLDIRQRLSGYTLRELISRVGHHDGFVFTGALSQAGGSGEAGKGVAGQPQRREAASRRFAWRHPLQTVNKGFWGRRWRRADDVGNSRGRRAIEDV